MAFISSTFAGKIKIGDLLKGILLGTDYTVAYPKAEILFDEDSILYNDDTVTL